LIHRSFSPAPHLKKYIREYILVHLELDEGQVVSVRPYPANPEQGITFYARGHVTATDSITGKSEKRPKAVIFGQPVCRQDLLPSNNYLMFDVRFQPGALYKLIRIPMTELVQKNLDAELILGREVRDLNDHLANISDYKDMVDAMESYLWKKINKLKEDDHPFEKIGRIIQDNPLPFSLEDIARESCLSPSQFERKFQLQNGISPKFFSRICRFYRAFELKTLHPRLDWLSIAVRTGYTDYQHLVKDFIQFSGNTPKSLIRDYDESLKPWLTAGIIPDFV
jgi:AraC-like DNA-binding protein